MVREAEEYAEEDKAVKDRIDARNSLESYLYNMKNLLDDEEKGVSDKISEADKEVSRRHACLPCVNATKHFPAARRYKVVSTYLRLL